MEKIRHITRTVIPEGEETITYGIPTVRWKKTNVVHFAAFKNHIGFYPTPSGMETFKDALSQYESGKGSVQFPLKQPIPYELIQQIVEFRIREVKKQK